MFVEAWRRAGTGSGDGRRAAWRGLQIGTAECGPGAGLRQVTALALVVFDLAGTTVEDDGQVPAAFTEALLDEGIRVTPDEIETFAGRPSERH